MVVHLNANIRFSLGEVVGKFIIFTFLMLGWTFYEMSGGADFVPESRIVAQAEAAPAPAAEPVTPQVTRGDTSNLVLISLPVTQQTDETPGTAEVIPARVSVTEEIPTTEAEVNSARSDDVSAAVAAIIAEQPEAETILEEPQLDLRLVAGSWVNMRSGPSTSFGVLETLPEGTEAEVLELSDNGWARIRITETGLEGWMAERLLTDG